MGNAETVKDFLATHKGKFFCNLCLSEQLMIPNQVQLNQLTRPLRNVKPYRGGRALCSVCDKDKECIAHM